RPHRRHRSRHHRAIALQPLRRMEFSPMRNFYDGSAAAQFLAPDLPGSPVSASAEICDSRFGLLPCPFCGSPARTDLLPHAQGPGWVQCSSCGCEQHMSDTLEEAVTRWNTRSSVLAQRWRVTDDL